jgi:CHAP domain-containing protein
MPGVEAMLKAARATLGMGEPNKIQDWYNDEVEDLGDWNWAWCAAAVSYWAAKSGNASAFKPRAYTVYMAQDFQKAGRWYSGTTANVKKARPGDIVLYDWGGSNNIGAIDHVGVCEKNLGDGRLVVIEGNTSNRCLRRVRSASSIAGFGRPAYPAAPKRHDWWDVVYRGVSLDVPWATPYLRRGMKSSRVGSMQKCANALGARLVVDNDFGPKTGAWLVGFQRTHRDENGRRLDVDEVYGHHSARALALALGVPRADVT